MSKADVYKQILNIAYHSKGALTFTDLYNLPVRVRQMYMSEIQNYIDEQNKTNRRSLRRRR